MNPWPLGGWRYDISSENKISCLKAMVHFFLVMGKTVDKRLHARWPPCSGIEAPELALGTMQTAAHLMCSVVL